MRQKLETRIKSEIARLADLKWRIPAQDKDGIRTPNKVNEELISFPSEDYSGEESNSEASGFWAEERAHVIGKMLRQRKINLLWEVGAGNGNAAIPLRKNGLDVVCVEPLRGGTLTLVKNDFLTFQATLETLELPDNSIKAIGAFDVLEHLEHPEILLGEIFRILSPGGYFVCSVPACQWLFSDFDISIGHYRRYSRRELEHLVATSGLNIIEKKSIFGYLILPAFVLRRIPYLLGLKQHSNNVKKKIWGRPSALNKLFFLFKFLSQVEEKLDLPIGLTHIFMSQKPFRIKG
jgi:SAM-dependent methyltransferase